MGLSKVRQVGRKVIQHVVSEGLRTVDAIIHKTALVHSLTHPLIRQAYDTRALDRGLLGGYEKYQRARQLSSEIGRIMN